MVEEEGSSKNNEIEDEQDIESSRPWGQDTFTSHLFAILIVISLLLMGSALIFGVLVDTGYVGDVSYLYDTSTSGSGTTGTDIPVVSTVVVDSETENECVYDCEEGDWRCFTREALCNSESFQLFSKGLEILVIIMILLCILVPIIAVFLAWVFYEVGKWLSKKERSCKRKTKCKCKWRKPWCCIKKLFCWLLWVLKWLSWIVAIALLIVAITTIVECIIKFIEVVII